MMGANYLAWVRNCLVGLLICLLYTTSLHAEEVVFLHDSNRLFSQYMPPTNFDNEGNLSTPKAVIIFIHGDGAMHHDAEGYYSAIWSSLRKEGYAVFSWDKPGVGSSSGNWLDQSMHDRQGEVRAAIAFLKKKYNYLGEQIGLLGFSQACWVIPAVAADNPDVGFVIGIGFAIDWVQQGWYLTRTRLQLEGKSELVIERETEKYYQSIEFLKTNPTYQQYLIQSGTDKSDLSEDRYQFILKNFRSNSLSDYTNIQQPMLILLGDKDLNVDIKHTQEKLKRLFESEDNLQIKVIADATHGLLKSTHFNSQSFSLKLWIKLMWMEEDAFASDFLSTLSYWLEGLKP